ncbi:hypothetical protein K438DRAFT_107367 [Mycena galopus ATCC 62051]|nr:hypothetical protein K438DRAFT_107367 [Mycena galopus ATCC 62051]
MSGADGHPCLPEMAAMTHWSPERGFHLPLTRPLTQSILRCFLACTRSASISELGLPCSRPINCLLFVSECILGVDPGPDPPRLFKRRLVFLRCGGIVSACPAGYPRSSPRRPHFNHTLLLQTHTTPARYNK